MQVLVLGGTRLSGIHLVKQLIANGHQVTIATRGITPDQFGDLVKRIIFDRRDRQSIEKAFKNHYYDAIVDNIAYSSNDIINILDYVKTQRYILTSSVSVYQELSLNILERVVDPYQLPLQSGDYQQLGYEEGKRQAEAALAQLYPQISSVMVRFPWIFGNDDYTLRLYYYVEKIVKQQPMRIDNLEEPLSFISSKDAGGFLAWCVDHLITGPVNAASLGTVTIFEIINYVEKKTGLKPMLSDSDEFAPLSCEQGFSLDLSIGLNSGYQFEKLSDWLESTLDYYIQKASEQLKL